MKLPKDKGFGIFVWSPGPEEDRLWPLIQTGYIRRLNSYTVIRIWTRQTITHTAEYVRTNRIDNYTVLADSLSLSLSLSLYIYIYIYIYIYRKQ